jgi:hypothetical protein
MLILCTRLSAPLPQHCYRSRSSGFFSGIKGWSTVHTNRFLSHPHSSTTRSCPTPCTRALQLLFSAYGASGYALLEGALTLICRYHSLYSTAVWGSRSIGPCAEKRSCRVGSARGRVGGSKLRYQNHWRSERADDVQKHLGSDRRL